VRLLLLSLISVVISACGYEGPTGYKAAPSYPGDSNLVETCKEEMFMDKWWAFETKNAIANTLVPAYKDYCTYTSEDSVYYWDTDKMVGYYDYSWEWYCTNKNTMKIVNEDSDDEISMRIYGSVGDGCYDVKITYGALVINGDLCSCEYTGP
jgi:hypothetical protein